MLHQMHRDIVPRVPPSVENLGCTSHCGVQGLYVKNRVISLQGHPEYSPWIANQLLNLRRGSAIEESTYQDGKSRANNPHDGVAVSATFLKFLLEK